MAFRRVVLLGAMGFALLFWAGCARVFTQAYHEVRGAGAKAKPIVELPIDAFEPFRSVEFAPASSEFSPRVVPPKVIAAYDRAADAAESRLARQFPGGAPRLLITTELLYFQEKGLLGTAQLIARVRMTGEGRAVGDLMIVAENRAYRAGDEDALARASVEEISRLLVTEKEATEEEGTEE